MVYDPLVNGIQLDTTWSIFNNYVASIPTLLDQNAGIPIGFRFSLHENTSIYMDFLGGTPRRNMFYSSIKRVFKEIMKHYHNFEKNFKQSYSRYNGKIKRLIKSIPDDVK